MRIFELHFNLKGRRDNVFDSFIYNSENTQETQAGSLCMAGELTSALPQNGSFLDSIANAIKNEFYADADFSKALNGVNNLLDKEAKSGNINWLGNLNFAVVNIKDSVLNFTKVGNIKILLLKDDEVLDISQNLELQDQEPYPTKVFGNIVSGKLSPQDKILIVTEEIFYAISKNETIFNQLNRVTKEAELKNIFKSNKDALSEISGICLLISEGSEPSAVAFQNIKFSFGWLPKKRAVLIVILILTLTAAYFIFGGKKEKPPDLTEQKLEQAHYKIMMAENFIILKKNEKARVLFQEARDILQSLKTKEASSLKESVEKYLINNNTD